MVAACALLAACSTQPPVEIVLADRLGMALVGPDPVVETLGTVHSEVSAAYGRNVVYGLLYAPMTLGASIFMSPAFGHSDAKDVRACLEPYFERRPNLVQDLAAAAQRELPHGEVLDEFARSWHVHYAGAQGLEPIGSAGDGDAVLHEAAVRRIDTLFEISLKKLAVEYEYPCAIETHVDLELRVIRVADRTELLNKSLWARSALVDSPDGMETLLTTPGKLKQEYLSTLGEAFANFFHNCLAGRCGPPYPLHVAETPEK